MWIKIDDTTYQIISTNSDGISIDNTNPDNPIIFAHALYSMDEVAAFVKQKEKYSKNNSIEDDYGLEFIRLNIFDIDQPVKIIRNANFNPYKKEHILIASAARSTDIHSDKFQNGIKDKYFEQIILQQIAFWEEELNILSNQIQFKKLKRSLFLIDSEEKNLCINKHNQGYSVHINSFIVCWALLSLKLNEKEIQEYLRSKFSDIDKIQKQLSHGK